MPQLSDTFLERIVDLADRNADRAFRQGLTEEIKEASLSTVPLEAAVQYDRELIDAFTATSTASSPGSLEIDAPWNALLSDLRMAIKQLNEIYQSASRQIYPETELFRVLGPPVTGTQRAISLSRVAMGWILTFLIALPLIVVIVLIHNRVREEQELEETLHEHPVS